MFDWISNIRKTNIGLSYYTNVNPYELDVNEWARRVTELAWFREQQSKSQQPDE